MTTKLSDIAYGEGRHLDLYLPEGPRPPVVVLVAGYRSADVEKYFGGKPRELPMARAWGERIAAAGLAAAIYSNVDPAPDLDAVLEHVRGRADVDGERIALWGASGNGPLALSRLAAARCAALLYPYLLGPEVEPAAARFGFTNPATAPDVIPPLYLIRAGADATPGLNATIDRFAADSLARDRPFTLVNVAGAPHAFDYTRDIEVSREIVGGAIDFLVRELRR